MFMKYCSDVLLGRFVWGGAGYADSSERGWLSIEGDNQPILRAALFDGDGNLVENVDINLAERIGNNDGQFYFREYSH